MSVVPGWLMLIFGALIIGLLYVAVMIVDPTPAGFLLYVSATLAGAVLISKVVPVGAEEITLPAISETEDKLTTACPSMYVEPLALMTM